MSQLLEALTIKYTHVLTKKVVLTGYYDKMQMINSVDCVPFGYKKINNM